MPRVLLAVAAEMPPGRPAVWKCFAPSGGNASSLPAAGFAALATARGGGGRVPSSPSQRPAGVIGHRSARRFAASVGQSPVAAAASARAGVDRGTSARRDRGSSRRSGTADRPSQLPSKPGLAPASQIARRQTRPASEQR